MAEEPGRKEETISVQVSFKGTQHSLPLPAQTTTVQDIHALVEAATGIQVPFQKLIHKGKTLTDPAVPLAQLAQGTTTQAVKLVLIGTTAAAVAAVAEGHKQVGNVRVINDLATTTSSSGARRAPAVLPSRRHGFQRIEVLPHLPEQDKARAILTELASDPGVLHVMAKYQWSVGALCEMYPEGYVGVSDVCVMGLNENKGQRILLRLRTDDLQGWRKILSVRKVLYHEMAHNVHSEHDDQFYVLMRTIEKEVNAFNSSGRALGGGRTYITGDAGVGGGGPVPFAGGSGRLGGASAEVAQVLSAREMAAQAAIQRLSEEEQAIEDACPSGRRSPAVHARPHDASSPVVDVVGQQPEREVVPLPPPPPPAVEAATTPEVVEEKPSSPPPTELPDMATVSMSPPPPPPPPPPAEPVHEQPSSPAVDAAMEDATEQLLALGFPETQVRRVLQECGGDVMLAADQLLLGAGGGGGGEAETNVASTTPGTALDMPPPDSRQARAMDAAQRLSLATRGDTAARTLAFSTLHTMLQALLDHPQNPKFRRVRLANTKFAWAVGRFPAGLDLLQAVGFEEAEGGAVLLYTRNDPGLLWLGRSIVEEERERSSA